MFVLGYLRGGRVPGLDCDRPLRWVCRDCGGHGVKACQNRRTDSCSPCAHRYLRRVRRVVEHGMETGAAAGWFVYLLTFTAPGYEGHRQWVYDPKGPRGDDRPICGCWRQMTEGIDVWNGTAARRWDRLNRSLKRLAPHAKFFRAVEPQDGKRRADGDGRGALHHHVVLCSPVPLDRVEVQRAALRAGYGCDVDVDHVTDPARASRYVTKYVTKGANGRASVPWRVPRADLETGEVRLVATVPTYRNVSQSQSWGLTVAEVRAALAGAARARRARAAADIDQVLVPDPPATDTPVLTLAGSGAPPDS